MKSLIRTSKTILLDDEDLERVLALEQEWGNEWYVRSDDNHVQLTLRMGHKTELARFILNYNGVLDVDHIDRNGLNNQKYNLRPVTRSINARNSGRSLHDVPQLKGVYWNNNSEKWVARVYVNKKPVHLGRFKTVEEAVAAQANFLLAKASS